MHRSRRVIMAGAVLSAAALALPFSTLDGVGTLNGLSADAWPILLLLVPVAAVALLGDRAEPPGRAAGVAMAVAALAAVAFAVVKVIDAHLASLDAGGSIGPGAWALLATAALTLGGGVMALGRRI